MKWINKLQHSIKVLPSAVFQRFPISAFFLLSLVVVCFLFIHRDFSEDYLPELMTLSLGVVFFHVFHLWRERQTPGNKSSLILAILITITLGVIYGYLDGVFSQKEASICTGIFYFGSVFLGILFLSFIPHLSGAENTVFLDYNRSVFIHYFSGLFFSLVFYLGLSLAMVAIDNLFSVNIDSKTYAYLAVLSFVLFLGFFFLANYPDPRLGHYEKPSIIFSILSQYIFLPIVVIYGGILLVYSTKNIFQAGEDPEWTQWLILWFYLFGFLTYLLNLTLTPHAGYGWAKKFCKWFYYVIIPMSTLTLISVFRSIKFSGLTELKYMLMAISVFFIGIGFYDYLSKNAKKISIPIVLSVLTMITIIGPQAACPASIRNQKTLLKSILSSEGLLIDGAFVKGKISDQQSQSRVRDILSFLHKRKEIQSLKSWDRNNLLADSLTIRQLQKFVFSNSLNSANHISFYGSYIYPAVDLSKYALFLPIASPYKDKPLDQQYITLSDKKYLMHKQNNKTLDTFNLSSAINIPLITEKHTLSISSSSATLDLYIMSIEIEDANDGYLIHNINAIAFLHKK